MSPLHFTLHTHFVKKESISILLVSSAIYEVSIYSVGEFCHSDVIYFVHVLVIYRTSPNECVYSYTKK